MAQRLAPPLRAVHLRSDIERKRLRGLPALARSGSALAQGLYSRRVTRAVYDRLAECATDALAGGCTTIVDATFGLSADRARFRALAAGLGIDTWIVYCHALPVLDPELPLPSAELLRRYDRPGPRYTSYPAAPQFTTAFTAADLRGFAARSNARPGPRPLSLYLHVPFCFSPCFYCGCNRLITRDTTKGVRYVERLLHEVALVAPLFEGGREVVQLHLGGGTPNFLGAATLEWLIHGL